MPPILSGFAFQSRQQYHLCAVLVQLVFLKMTHDKFHELDEMREKDEKLFEAAVDLLFSIGFDNFTEEMAAEAMHEAKEDFDVSNPSVDDMLTLVAKMLVLGAASELRSFSLTVLLDYIAEKGWRA